MPDNSFTWGKFAQYVLPVLLTALIAVIGFLVMQILSLSEQIGELKVQLGRQEVTVRNLSSKIDAITITRFRGEP